MPADLNFKVRKRAEITIHGDTSLEDLYEALMEIRTSPSAADPTIDGDTAVSVFTGDSGSPEQGDVTLVFEQEDEGR